LPDGPRGIRPLSDALLGAELAETKEWEKAEYFEGCLPIEVLARRGRDTLRFGPMKPVACATTHRQNTWPWCSAQGKSARRQLQPGGLSEPPEVRRTGAGAAAEFRGWRMRAFCVMGQIHRNTYICAPVLLDETLRLKLRAGNSDRGQLSGWRGTRNRLRRCLLAGIYAAALARGKEPVPAPRACALGSLVHYITHAGVKKLSAGEYDL